MRQQNRFFLLIPLLREQSVIRENINTFSALKGNYTLVYITTQKEQSESNVLSTKEVLEHLKDEMDLDFVHFHYPYLDGGMAHQLNFALEELIKSQRLLPNDYVAVFNADSQISPQYIVRLDSYIQIMNNPPVVQQSALFVKNYNSFSNSMIGRILKNIALLQSHWTLVHEVPRLRRTSSPNKITRFFESGHVVGHGMVIKTSVLQQVGLFPTIHTNEDLPLGYYLGNLGIPIHVFPDFEFAESPRTLTQVLRQYTTWFYGTAAYPAYFFHFTRINGFKLRALVTALRNSIRAYIWPFMGLFWIYLILYPTVTKQSLLLLIAVITFFLEYILGFIITHKIARKEVKNIGIQLQDLNFLQILLMYPSYVAHTFGPLRGLYRIFVGKIYGIKFEKEKTERTI